MQFHVPSPRSTAHSAAGTLNCLPKRSHHVFPELLNPLSGKRRFLGDNPIMVEDAYVLRYIITEGWNYSIGGHWLFRCARQEIRNNLNTKPGQNSGISRLFSINLSGFRDDVLDGLNLKWLKPIFQQHTQA